MRLVIILGLLLGAYSGADNLDKGRAACKAEINDDVGQPLGDSAWVEETYIGHIETPGRVILISTSMGFDKQMSLWVREKTQSPYPWGMYTFMDFTSGRPQYGRFYLPNGISVGVTCEFVATKN